MNRNTFKAPPSPPFYFWFAFSEQFLKIDIQ